MQCANRFLLAVCMIAHAVACQPNAREVGPDGAAAGGVDAAAPDAGWGLDAGAAENAVDASATPGWDGAVAPVVDAAADDAAGPCADGSRLDASIFDASTAPDAGGQGRDAGTVDAGGGPSGACMGRAEGTPCDDGDPCTAADRCAGGACAAGPAISCDDGNPCTADNCDPAVGCLHDGTGITLVCGSDGACDRAARCQGDAAGTCTATAARDCSELDDPCNVGLCDPTTGACRKVPTFDGLACDDGDACSTGEHCEAGRCGGGTTLSCDDGNPCTVDSCDPNAGCVNDGTGVTDPCAPDTGCETDFRCVGNAIGTCLPTTRKSCRELDDWCVYGRCEPATGNCVREIDHSVTICDDGDPCSFGDRCIGGVCLGPSINDCDDGNDCTADYCDRGTGACSHINRCLQQ